MVLIAVHCSRCIGAIADVLYFAFWGLATHVTNQDNASLALSWVDIQETVAKTSEVFPFLLDVSN